MIRASLYDALIVRLTSGWYRAVLERLPQGCRLLDVGIGTGSALVVNAHLLVQKDLHVVGVDIDAAYIERCRAKVAQARLGDRIEPRLASIYDHRGGPYDAVYFSASFMLLPDPAGALRHVAAQLTGGGRIYFTQTFEHRPSRLIETVKPLLRWLTTIDFGRVTYQPEFERALASGGVEVEECVVLHPGKRRSSVLVTATPKRPL